MEMNCQDFPARKFLTPPCGNSKRWSPMRPMSEKKWSSPPAKRDLFHVIHKVPAGDSPYVRAKHVQLIDKDPGKAVSLFWAAINSGDRVDSALKDMAVVMKQLNRADEAIEAIRSFRHLCPAESQESLDNVLVELYKRSGRIEDQIEMLELKVKSIEEGIAFAGKRTKSARSQGKKILITIEQEYSRLLGNLAWAYLQNSNYKSAEELYRKALSLEQDKNKQCNLAICLMHMNRMTEARFLLQTIRNTCDDGKDYESFSKSYERATEVLAELESQKTEIPALEEASQIKGTGFRDQHDNPYSASMNLKFGSFETGDMDAFSPQISSATGSYHENIYGKRDAFVEKRNGRWVTEASFSCRRPYAPPVPGTDIPRVPYTQPKRAPPSFIDRDQRNGAVLGGCNRKLSFDRGQGCESLQLLDTQSSDGIGGDWRKKSLEDHSILGNNVRKSNPNEGKSTNAGQRKLTEEGRDSEKSGGSYGALAENVKPIEEEEQPIHSLSCQAKRNWADMVEEDEQEMLSGRTDEFADENVNSNISYQAMTPSNNIENLSLKLGSCDLKDGYRTQPESKDRVARRSLCFGEQDKTTKCCCCSPLRNVALNFEGRGHSSMECVKDQDIIRSGTKLARRKRLQVFRDITP